MNKGDRVYDVTINQDATIIKVVYPEYGVVLYTLQYDNGKTRERFASEFICLTHDYTC
jgi:hypothetical protein